MFSKWLNWNWSRGPFSNSVFKASILHWFLAEFLFSVTLMTDYRKHGGFNRNWFSYVSRLQKPYTGLMGLKSKRPQDWVPFGGSRGESISLTFAHMCPPSSNSAKAGPVFCTWIWPPRLPSSYTFKDLIITLSPPGWSRTICSPQDLKL